PLLQGVMMLSIAPIAEFSATEWETYIIDDLVAKGQYQLAIAAGLAISYILLKILEDSLHYFQTLLYNRVAVGVVQQLRIDVMDAALR
ncbi:multidrug ABC transporter permease/ATP-binding protein, partial [Pectobacterium brasiliense]|nr:multidrug ABC transporter permease/ATP-binding protein [Pectobacterium brasiliense]